MLMDTVELQDGSCGATSYSSTAAREGLNMGARGYFLVRLLARREALASRYRLIFATAWRFCASALVRGFLPLPSSSPLENHFVR